MNTAATEIENVEVPLCYGPHAPHVWATCASCRTYCDNPNA